MSADPACPFGTAGGDPRGAARGPSPRLDNHEATVASAVVPQARRLNRSVAFPTPASSRFTPKDPPGSTGSSPGPAGPPQLPHLASPRASQHNSPKTMQIEAVPEGGQLRLVPAQHCVASSIGKIPGVSQEGGIQRRDVTFALNSPF